MQQAKQPCGWTTSPLQPAARTELIFQLAIPNLEDYKRKLSASGSVAVPMQRWLLEGIRRAADAKEVGVGNSAEETCCCPDSLRAPLWSKRAKSQFNSIRRGADADIGFPVSKGHDHGYSSLLDFTGNFAPNAITSAATRARPEALKLASYLKRWRKTAILWTC